MKILFFFFHYFSCRFFSKRQTGNCTYSAIGLGANHTVYSTTFYKNELYITGDFLSVDSTPAQRIAKFNGTNWLPLKGGLDTSGSSLAVFQNELYVAGSFDNVDGVQSHSFTKWNGSHWFVIPSTLFNVQYLKSTPSFLYVGGSFPMMGNVTVNYIAKWDGTNWFALGSGVDNFVEAIEIVGSNVYVGGSFLKTGDGLLNVSRIAMFDGNNWKALGNGTNGDVRAIASNGVDVFIGGAFTNVGGVAGTNRIARWNGTQWFALSSGLTTSYVTSFVFIASDLWIGGAFSGSLKMWNGNSFLNPGSGVGSSIETLYYKQDTSELYFGGSFTTAGGISSNRIAKYSVCAPTPQPTPKPTPPTPQPSPKYPTPQPTPVAPTPPTPPTPTPSPTPEPTPIPTTAQIDTGFSEVSKQENELK